MSTAIKPEETAPGSQTTSQACSTATFEGVSAALLQRPVLQLARDLDRVANRIAPRRGDTISRAPRHPRQSGLRGCRTAIQTKERPRPPAGGEATRAGAGSSARNVWSSWSEPHSHGTPARPRACASSPARSRQNSTAPSAPKYPAFLARRSGRPRACWAERRPPRPGAADAILPGLGQQRKKCVPAVNTG
jgi:hypothetical protein